jgi:palmitoyl-protein thioesterase
MLYVLNFTTSKAVPYVKRPSTYTTTQTTTYISTYTSTPTTTYTKTRINENYPIVVLHGIGSSSQKMEPLCEWLGTTFNTTVYNIEIGNGARTSVYTPMNKQLTELCFSIYAIEELADGFDFIGISQGGLLARGYVERCNSYPVRNLITFVSPHGGTFLLNSFTIYNGAMYSNLLQSQLSITNYWRNPSMLDIYLTRCSYLPELNNEVWRENTSTIQRDNMRNLLNFVMVWSPMDEVLHPVESGKFSFYDIFFNVIPLEETEMYKNDALGLKFLNNKGGLHTYETNCSHEEHRNPVCFDQLYAILQQFL